MPNAKTIPKDRILKSLKALQTDYINHGDSLKWFRSRKLEILKTHGLKNKEEQDQFLESLKKELGLEHPMRPYL